LITLGVRDCNAPKSNEPQIVDASAAAEEPPRVAEASGEKQLFAGVFDEIFSVLGIGEAALGLPSRPASLPRPAPGPKVLLAEIPLPPQRPAEFAATGDPQFSQRPGESVGEIGAESAEEPQAGPLRAKPAQAQEAAPPPPRPAEAAAQGGGAAAAQERSKPQLPAIITGAQPIIPSRCLRLRGIGPVRRGQLNVIKGDVIKGDPNLSEHRLPAEQAAPQESLAALPIFRGGLCGGERLCWSRP
jgi:hypothetical protein